MEPRLDRLTPSHLHSLEPKLVLSASSLESLGGGKFMSVQELTLDLVIRYGFQVLGAVVILIVGFFLSRWAGNVTQRWLEPRVKEPPVRTLIVRAVRILVVILVL